MRIAITGADGMLGTDLCEILSKKHEIIKLIYPDFNIIQAEDVRARLLGEKPDLVINTAAYTNVDACEDNFDEAFNINAFGAQNIAHAAKETNIPLVHISTDYIFDGEKKGPYKEEDRPNPINVYGKSKLDGENYIKNTLIEYYIIRTSWLFGKHGKNFVKTIIAAAKRNPELRVVDDQIGSPTFTKDLAEGIASLIKKKPGFGIYNLTNDDTCSWFEFTKKIIEHSNLKNINVIPIDSNEIKRKAIRPKNSRLNNSKINNIGIKLRPWEKALIDYLKDPGKII